MAAKQLNAAKRLKNDEFYTRYPDVEKELKHYVTKFKNRTIYLNCDNPKHSAFWKYFVNNFSALGIKRLVSTYLMEPKSTKTVAYLDELGNLITHEEELTGNGSFSSEEAIELLKEADVVITNPPFSLLAEYLALILSHGKSFLIIIPASALACSYIAKAIITNKATVGKHSAFKFLTPSGELKPIPCRWLTNLLDGFRPPPIQLNRLYNPLDYPKYDNFDAINVNKVKDIPCDYFDIMGVPTNYLAKYNPSQFEILKLISPVIDGRRIFIRAMIKRRSKI